MKAEERHELKENDLATWTYKVPMLLRDYGSYVLLAVALGILGYQGYGWYHAKQMQQIYTTQSELVDASGNLYAGLMGDPVKLRTLIGNTEDKNVQALAYTALGDFYSDYLTLGTVTSDVKISLTPDEAVKQALDAYNKVLGNYPENQLCTVRAHLGIGRIYEFQGQWDLAKAEYEKLTKGDQKATVAPFAAVAQYRLDHLSQWQQKVVFGPATPASATAPSSTAPATVGSPLLK